jgi:hypothetical protein
VDGVWRTVAEPRQEQAREARVHHRGFDGRRREAQATERRRGDAEASVLRRVEQRLRGLEDLELGSTMLFTEASEWYLAQLARGDSGLSERTVGDYSAARRRYVVAVS